MRPWKTWVTGLALALVSGCASPTKPPGTTAWERTKGGFAVTYDAVKSGARAVGKAGGWVLARAGDGVVRVVRVVPMGTADERITDGWITAKVKSQFGISRRVRAGHIDVDTRDQIVSLRGTVADADHAEAAIAEALNVPGVKAVNSELSFPTPPKPRVFTKGEEIRVQQ